MRPSDFAKNFKDNLSRKPLYTSLPLNPKERRCSDDIVRLQKVKAHCFSSDFAGKFGINSFIMIGFLIEHLIVNSEYVSDFLED